MWHQGSRGDASSRFSAPEPRRPSSFDSPVLRQVYPALVAFKQRFGHVNIPLGSTDGRKCETLRRLQVQGKLSEADVAALDAINFRWHSLEDVYRTVNFSDLYTRLLRYGIENGGDLSVPKKYAPDPELGAWVTGVRRVGRGAVESRHAEMLDEIGFEWESPRKCGSSFMKRYREIRQLKDDGVDILEDDKVQGWVRAQQEAAKRGALSETRMHYMEQLLPGWMEWETAEPVAE
jgi:Helicase associated domain